MKEHKKLRRGWVGQVFSASCEHGKKRGVAILCHRSLDLVPETVHEDKKGRHIMVVGTIKNESITILNLYAPNEEGSGFL